jgi:hypothetical protein
MLPAFLVVIWDGSTETHLVSWFVPMANAALRPELCEMPYKQKRPVPKHRAIVFCSITAGEYQSDRDRKV